jgi:hypothetical protein
MTLSNNKHLPQLTQENTMSAMMVTQKQTSSKEMACKIRRR